MADCASTGGILLLYRKGGSPRDHNLLALLYHSNKEGGCKLNKLSEILAQGSITISGIHHTIKRFQQNARDDETLGRYDFREAYIGISDGLPKEVAEMILLHEIIHGILDTTGIEVSEEIVSTLASGLYATLKG